MRVAHAPVYAAAAFILAAALAPAPASARTAYPASARTAYDGNWSVLIVTNSGPCDRAYRYGLSIRDGAVIYQGSAAVNVAGRGHPNAPVSGPGWAGPQGAHRAPVVSPGGAAPASPAHSAPPTTPS